jgi:hypothetical protein
MTIFFRFINGWFCVGDLRRGVRFEVKVGRTCELNNITKKRVLDSLRIKAPCGLPSEGKKQKKSALENEISIPLKGS